MGKRFGRNQRRHLKEEVTRLEMRGDIAIAELERLGEKSRRLHYQMKDWAQRIVARLGPESAFALEKLVVEWHGGDRMMMPLPSRMMPVSERMDYYAERMTKDLIALFVHHVESTYDKNGGRDLKGQLVLHLYRGADHEPLYIALSAQQMDNIRYSKDDQYMDFLIKGLARQFARHAEEIQRGR